MSTWLYEGHCNLVETGILTAGKSIAHRQTVTTLVRERNQRDCGASPRIVVRSSPDVGFLSLEVAWNLKRMMDISVDYSIVLSSMIALLARCDVLGVVPLTMTKRLM